MPKQGRTPKLISKFLRVNEDVSLNELKEGEIPLLKDMVLDNPFGKPRIRGGFQELNTNEPTNLIRTYEDVKSQDGTNYQLVGHLTFISRSQGGAYTNIVTGLDAFQQTGAFRHTSFGDDIIITNNSVVDKPFRLSGDDLSTVTPLELIKPDVDEVIVQREKNILADAKLDFSSQYLYMLIYVTEVGERSNPSNPILFVGAGNDQPYSTNATLSRLYIDNLPIPTDGRVKSKWLFRTEGWDLANNTGAKIFYLLKKLDVDVVDFEDNVADDALDFSESIIYSRVPDSAKYVIQSNNRVFFGNINVHQKSFWEPHVVAQGNAGDQTPSSITYEDGVVDNISSLGVNIPRYADVAYSGGGGGEGGLAAEKWYQYMYVYEDINGYESEPSYGQVFQTGGTAGGYRDVYISFLGMGGIGANNYKNNPELKFRNLYRTVRNDTEFTPNSQPFALVRKFNIQHEEAPSIALVRPSTPYDWYDDLYDVAKDSGVGLGGVYAEVEKEGKSSIAWSQADRPAYFLAENIRQIFNDDQDEITGILDDGNGVLIFKENSIVKLYHTGASKNWYIRKVWNKFGCDNEHSLIKAGSQIYFHYRKQPYSYLSGQAPKYIGYGKQTFFDKAGLQIDSVTATQKWICWLGEDDGSWFVVVWDTRTQTWYEFTLGAYETTFISTNIYNSDPDDRDKILTGDKVVYEYQEDDPTEELSGSGVEVSAEIQLPRIQLDGVTKSKLRDIVANLQRNGSETINLKMDTEDASHSNVAIPSGEGIIRITGWGGKPSSGFFDITLSGGLERLDHLRADLRPKRIGVGSI